MNTSAEAIAQIEAVDRLHDAAIAALQMRLRLNLSVTGHGLDINAWDRAWARCPDLEVRRDALTRQRGLLQLDRDRLINREWPAEQRRIRKIEKAEWDRRAHTTALAA